MSIRIEVHLPDEDVSITNMGRHMAALGFFRPDTPGAAEAISALQALAVDRAVDVADVKEAEEADTALYASGVDKAPEDKPKRTRRTKAEIEAERASAPAPAALVAAADKVVEKLEQAAEAEQRAISTSPEDRKQDEADEAAEQPEELTTDSVRKLAGDYVAKFGIAAANEDGHRIFTAALGPVPADLKDSKGVPVTQWRMSVIPSEPDALRKMVHAWEEALETNPFDRTAVS